MTTATRGKQPWKWRTGRYSRSGLNKEVRLLSSLGGYGLSCNSGRHGMYLVGVTMTIHLFSSLKWLQHDTGLEQAYRASVDGRPTC